MVFHPSHRPLEIATRFPQFHSPDDDDISPTNKKHKGTLLSSYRGGHFYWALTNCSATGTGNVRMLRNCGFAVHRSKDGRTGPQSIEQQHRTIS